MDFESLRKILKLELSKGYADTAVIGGLDRFLQNWSGPAIASISNRRLLGRFRKLGLDKPHYATLTREQRQQWAAEVLNLLEEILAEAEKKPGPKSAPRTSHPTPRARQPGPVAGSLDSPITVVKGISASTATRFEKLGVRTIRDLLYLFPHRHLDYSRIKTVSQLTEGEEETIVANVWQATETRPGGRRSTEAIVGDETGNVRAVWFNNPYLVRQLTTNTRIVLSGRVKLFQGRYVFESPEWEPVQETDLIHTGRLVPVYPLTQGLRPRQVRKLMKQVTDQWAWQVPDFLPEAIKQHRDLLELPQAIYHAHYPDDEALKDRARVRLAFDELFLLQLGVLNKKREWQEDQAANPLGTQIEVLDKFIKSLPFQLTAAQDRVLKELLADLEKSKSMSRLLQGEVGSGKTVVATAGLLMAAANDCQGALMAPTEILAEQHFGTICQLLSATGQTGEQENHINTYSGILSRPITVALLMGATPAARKRELHRQIQDGDIDIVIGTHALIQKEVEFQRMGLTVIDEQHRFGVAQRSTLRQKGHNPHVLVMTATPIPRTLALTLYGDLDLSVIDELPPGRQEIKTKWLKPSQRESAYAFLRREISAGRQAFIICPLIEESEVVQARAATIEHEHLSREVFPDLKLGLLHGRLSAADKEKVMRRFYNDELDILVSTAVVEVGIDVPNATVMMVESADRFGLSQLHQFRGRVGRGKEQSYCMLMAQEPSEVARMRLDIIENTQDGFKLAEEDLKLRGPGEFFGTRQSGLPDLRMAKLSDVPLLEMARTEALKLFEEDRALEKPEHAPLLKEMTRVWTTEAGEWS
ncbi:MAG: ATP-dependent DNA helicase RecG [Dehalococcoidales bacterium]|nr:MAG: ATP-dependent DNA helicase RecG [Dehalococcoidales bacterium]